MFTGIVEEIGMVKELKQKGSVWDLKVHAKKVSKGLKIGESVAVNGACLTVVKIKKPLLLFQIQEETLRCTALGELKKGVGVNLERALKASGRFNGHIVQGHVDGVGKINSLKENKKDVVLSLTFPKKLKPYFVSKGSITLNGVSLTLVKVTSNCLTVHLIPHTLKETTLQDCRPNGKINIEVDILAKYMEQMLKK